MTTLRKTLLSPQRWALAICALAAALRLYKLQHIPNGFSPDEASYGYNGYSFLLTGRDRFGEFLPLFADNFGDLISASYMWLTVPSIALFGLDEFAVRLPAALLGVAAVWVMYLLGREFFNNRAGLLAALCLAISPWHIQVSRYAERSPLLPLLFCLGLLYLLRWRRCGGNALFYSALAFALCLYSYASARVFVLVFLLGSALLYGSELWADRRRAIQAALLFIALSLPAVYHWTSPEGMARAHYLLSWDPAGWFSNYLSYLSPDYLFLNGDANLRHSLKDVGQLHVWECVTVVLGLIVCARHRERSYALIALWLLLYPLPAALTEPGHAIRSIVGAPLFALLSGAGLDALLAWTPTHRKRWIALSFGCIIALSLGLYGKRYFVDYPTYGAQWWMYGLRSAFEKVELFPHARLFIGNNIQFAHIYALFYTHYSPSEYQKAPLRAIQQGQWWYESFRFGIYEVNSVEEIMRRPCANSTLIAVASEARPYVDTTRWHLVHTVSLPDGSPQLDVLACP